MIPINPEAIGDPNQTPVVYIGEEAGKALGIPQRTEKTMSDARKAAIVETIIGFRWWNYGLDNVSEVAEEYADYARDLADEILAKLDEWAVFGA